MTLPRLCRRLAALFRDSRGATAVEYGLICALIVLGAMAAIRGLADATVGTWTKVDTAVEQANQP